MTNQTDVSHAFTIDVEDWYHGTKYVYEDIRESRRLDYSLNLLLDILSEYDVYATFFWLGKAAEENPKLLKKVASLGHEIGCHGWNHEPICRMDRNRFKDETYHALSLLSDLSGRTVTVYRAPYFSITQESLWALQVLVELGIQYDSSIFPLKKGQYGIPNFTPDIHDIATESGFITEVPISINKVLGFSIPASGGGFFRFYPFQVTYWNFCSLQRSRKPAIFYIHPWELDPSRPFSNQTFTERVRNQLGIKSTEVKTKRLLKNFSFNTLTKVALSFKNILASTH
ncbi:polysaccharide deacetylase family protein [Leptolyngbya ohadii]|uniref:polysaccharide deacetylase family protein n=1 Tax=Leptolyngbya ohadii TaxID=1962290 RepID=UPI000B59E912|nr:polysaccharide deacetylase family protein [Leptolyngbya ohadii]